MGGTTDFSPWEGPHNAFILVLYEDEMRGVAGAFQILKEFDSVSYASLV